MEKTLNRQLLELEYRDLCQILDDRGLSYLEIDDMDQISTPDLRKVVRSMQVLARTPQR